MLQISLFFRGEMPVHLEVNPLWLYTSRLRAAAAEVRFLEAEETAVARSRSLHIQRLVTSYDSLLLSGRSSLIPSNRYSCPHHKHPNQSQEGLSPEIQEAMRVLGIPESVGGEPSPPIDQWERYDCFPVLLPPDAEKYLAGREGEMTVLEKDYLEERIETFRGVKPPWGICFAAGKARLMRGTS